MHCILFAGGKSSRMGEDKSLLPFGGFPTLTQFQYDRLCKLFTHVSVSTKTADKFDFDASFILDPEEVAYAPTAGFVSSFRAIEDERIMVLSVDTPFVDDAVFQSLIDADERELDAVVAKTATGSHPLCGIYHRSLLEEFERMLREGDHRLGKLLASRHTKYVEFEDEEVFSNLNHPHEYQQALSRFYEPNK
ncbi:MAG: molybdenum cofactor guanylyltransferase MobA [Sulfuricurvum sp.]|uniref:molybdenum cofactor guanylyltransferase MobA n=1 Tax=Sulfuricurvum sp. TaxID=2025608 RepID=UPI002638EEA5|nr:molybdenum cofactor guanylyltransferase MobA [Sulfuricurvum sp.]MDD2950530.1 molybdenum cofactor guanylyltransferase MobA [Sulfuricurvum sp.]MDD5119061.1 molybdenum cofactor guanylyltransferase MobA [Sulfuricurvum sp.]